MENKNSIPVESKKKKKKLPIIILIIIGALLLMIGAVVLTIMLKLGKMSKNSVGTVPTPADLPDVTAEPVELVPVGDPSELDLTEDYYPDMIDMEFGNDPIFARNTIDANVVNILLLGNDARDEYDHGRADTIMILSFNKQTRTIKLVSILRDTWIYIPGRDKWNRINAAYQFGGTGLAINTINLNFDLDIQYYMRVDFNSLKSIVNELGGIDIELTEREVEYINNGCGGEDLPVHAGWHHLNG
ncbi:MAG: LCP family protein, partial [Clostridia bacterium]|nr:LCP family protein [Clostridia bacterium]